MDIIKELGKELLRQEAACKNNLYKLTEEASRKANTIVTLVKASKAYKDHDISVEISHSPAVSQIGITISGYVLDSYFTDVIGILSQADIYTIDATADCRVCICIGINNAYKIIGRRN